MLNRPELLAPLEIFMMIQKLGYSLPLLARLSERALELLALPFDGIPRLLLDIGLSLDHYIDAWQKEQEQCFRSQKKNLAINHPLVSYSSSEFHHSLIELFFCHGTKTRKEYPMLTCGPPSLSTVVPRGEGEDGESCSEDENSEKKSNDLYALPVAVAALTG
ncbi:hypothetical protein D5086_018947 [Populus alba]|uniref:Uncharacterized protein n=1 Tax=Populus alba TaxID=43335 RepID=A0ACC4BHI0_POPAL